MKLLYSLFLLSLASGLVAPKPTGTDGLDAFIDILKNVAADFGAPANMDPSNNKTIEYAMKITRKNHLRAGRHSRGRQ
ncbi:hypothetical protein QR680_008417 [Steinernema hermaphroditum]|uniref:Uncharacterized protein n=1 Tax=Steinernema hermaphroditum TaxID=289476 RepID=A0AA39IGI2_9BILA|nr:hypothetical protein QR680_008417 [Steinernema hermaphroditum]